VDLGSDFDQFVRDSSPGLLRTAYLPTGDRGHAEDIVQTALLQVARKWRRIHAASPHRMRIGPWSISPRTTGETASDARARAARA
jgi:DNA-directed RNA polymerase specialized sigma24 family protein